MTRANTTINSIELKKYHLYACSKSIIGYSKIHISHIENANFEHNQQTERYRTYGLAMIETTMFKSSQTRKAVVR